jgi:hypothetical protein
VRVAILISLAALSLVETAAQGDPALISCEVGPHGGYLVPVAYAEAHRADILSTLPDSPELGDFWPVSEQIAIVANRNLREAIEDAAKDPKLLFPDLVPGGDSSSPDSLEYQRTELGLVLQHYDAYLRQYAGVMINGRHFVLLNYVVGPNLDPAKGFIFIHRTFEPGKMRFLQARFDWDWKKLSNVSLYGTWQEKPK